MTEYTSGHIRVAWAVHALTASGVIVGYVALNSVIEGHARAAILWLVGTLLVDAVDGPIARHLDVKARVPQLNGEVLDLVIDYFTGVVVPVAFIYRFDLVPDDTGGPIGFTILFISALWMARRDQETVDGWFRGFPVAWNMIIPTLYLIRGNGWVNLTICAALCVLTLSHVNFPHPVSVRERRGISLGFMVLWLGSMLWLAIAQHDVAPVRIVLIIAPLWTIAQMIMRLRQIGRAHV